MKTIWAALFLAGLLVTPARAETVTYLHTDLLGSVVLETDQNRNVVARYEYEPYGLPRQAIADAPGYTGHVHDAGSRLVYMQQRYYDPEVGQFLSVDPMPSDTATGWNFNRYNYAANNPYTFVDPDGRVCVPFFSSSEMCDRSLRYAAVDQASSIREQTRFFAAASMVTNAMATLAPMLEPFMADLSRQLERHNMIIAEAIRNGYSLSGGSPAERDATFVNLEQTLVQAAFDQFRDDYPNYYAFAMGYANALVNNPSDTADPNFARAVSMAREEIGGPMDIRNQAHREALGRAAAAVARSTKNFCTGSRIRRC